MIPLAYFGARLSIIDFKSHRLPNHLVGWFTARNPHHGHNRVDGI
jgi:hypothetical protein